MMSMVQSQTYMLTLILTTVHHPASMSFVEEAVLEWLGFVLCTVQVRTTSLLKCSFKVVKIV